MNGYRFMRWRQKLAEIGAAWSADQVAVFLGVYPK